LLFLVHRFGTITGFARMNAAFAARGRCRNGREFRQRSPDREIPNPLIFLDMPDKRDA
jgi:hypothetical protein